MNFPWDILKLPESCQLNKRVFKKLFYDHVRLTATDKKRFGEDIAHIAIRYSLKPVVSGIPALEEAAFSYGEILIMETELNPGTEDRLPRIAEIMQRAIPYPLLLVFRCDGMVFFAAGDKRYSQSDDRAATLNRLWLTDGFKPEMLLQEQQAFLEAMAFPQQPRIQLKAFYQNWLECFRAYEAAVISGTFTTLAESNARVYRAEVLETYRELNQKLTGLRAQLGKATSFNQKVTLNTQMHALKRQLSQLEQEL